MYIYYQFISLACFKILAVLITKAVKGIVENHVRRVGDVLERSVDTQTPQPGTSRNTPNTAMTDFERIASIKRASNWIKMKKALNRKFPVKLESFCDHQCK